MREKTMSRYTVNVQLQFPAMPAPVRVEVTPDQLFFLDRNAERRLAADGSAIYIPARPIPQEARTFH
jgi:hypothetical protein